MPSYVVHICLATEYARKHKVENEEEFIEGTIYPDGVMPKSISHYSPKYSEDTNLYEFLLDKKLDSSFNEGYFLHLLADCLFYKKYFPEHVNFEYERLKEDFDRLSLKLLDYYKIEKVPEEAKPYVRQREGENLFYQFDKIISFIEIVSKIELHEVAREILDKKDYKFLLK